MILHRLAIRFRQQDWLAVAIELVVVVLGVFIGLRACRQRCANNMPPAPTSAHHTDWFHPPTRHLRHRFQ